MNGHAMESSLMDDSSLHITIALVTEHFSQNQVKIHSLNEQPALIGISVNNDDKLWVLNASQDRLKLNFKLFHTLSLHNSFKINLSWMIGYALSNTQDQHHICCLFPLQILQSLCLQCFISQRFDQFITFCQCVYVETQFYVLNENILIPHNADSIEIKLHEIWPIIILSEVFGCNRVFEDAISKLYHIMKSNPIHVFHQSLFHQSSLQQNSLLYLTNKLFESLMNHFESACVYLRPSRSERYVDKPPTSLKQPQSASHRYDPSLRCQMTLKEHEVNRSISSQSKFNGKVSNRNADYLEMDENTSLIEDDYSDSEIAVGKYGVTTGSSQLPSVTRQHRHNHSHRLKSYPVDSSYVEAGKLKNSVNLSDIYSSSRDAYTLSRSSENGHGDHEAKHDKPNLILRDAETQTQVFSDYPLGLRGSSFGNGISRESDSKQQDGVSGNPTYLVDRLVDDEATYVRKIVDPNASQKSRKNDSYKHRYVAFVDSDDPRRSHDVDVDSDDEYSARSRHIVYEKSVRDSKRHPGGSRHTQRMEEKVIDIDEANEYDDEAVDVNCNDSDNSSIYERESSEEGESYDEQSHSPSVLTRKSKQSLIDSWDRTGSTAKSKLSLNDLKDNSKSQTLSESVQRQQISDSTVDIRSSAESTQSESDNHLKHNNSSTRSWLPANTTVPTLLKSSSLLHNDVPQFTSTANSTSENEDIVNSARRRAVTRSRQYIHKHPYETANSSHINPKDKAKSNNHQKLRQVELTASIARISSMNGNNNNARESTESFGEYLHNQHQSLNDISVRTSKIENYLLTKQDQRRSTQNSSQVAENRASDLNLPKRSTSPIASLDQKTSQHQSSKTFSASKVKPSKQESPQSPQPINIKSSQTKSPQFTTSNEKLRPKLSKTLPQAVTSEGLNGIVSQRRQSNSHDIKTPTKSIQQSDSLIVTRDKSLTSNNSSPSVIIESIPLAESVDESRRRAKQRIIEAKKLQKLKKQKEDEEMLKKKQQKWIERDQKITSFIERQVRSSQYEQVVSPDDLLGLNRSRLIVSPSRSSVQHPSPWNTSSSTGDVPVTPPDTIVKRPEDFLRSSSSRDSPVTPGRSSRSPVNRISKMSYTGGRVLETTEGPEEHDVNMKFPSSSSDSRRRPWEVYEEEDTSQLYSRYTHEQLAAVGLGSANRSDKPILASDAAVKNAEEIESLIDNVLNTSSQSKELSKPNALRSRVDNNKQSSISGNIASPNISKNHRRVSTAKYPPANSTILVTIVRAWGLQEGLGMTNPYIVLDWGQFGRSATHSVANSSTPQFGSSLRFKSGLVYETEVNSIYDNVISFLDQSTAQDIDIERFTMGRRFYYKLSETPMNVYVYSRNSTVSDELLGEAVVQPQHLLEAFRSSYSKQHMSILTLVSLHNELNKSDNRKISLSKSRVADLVSCPGKEWTEVESEDIGLTVSLVSLDAQPVGFVQMYFSIE